MGEGRESDRTARGKRTELCPAVTPRVDKSGSRAPTPTHPQGGGCGAAKQQARPTRINISII
eukprot:scaffold3843_cov117-Isochrysis_galbana.AAC.2